MDCKQTKDRIPEWMDSVLSAEEAAAVGQHLARCAECRTEFKTYAKAWNTLKAWPDAEPDPGYLSRFWTRVSLQKPWHERLLENLQPVMQEKWFVPTGTAFATAFLAIVISSVTLYNTSSVVQTETLISSLSADDIEFVENIELAENLDAIQDIDLLEDLEVIENLDEFNV